MNVTKSVLELNDVHQLVEQLSEMLQKAVILENNNFELLAYSSPNEYSFDPIQQKTILTKRCPLFIIERLRQDGVVERLKDEDKPVRLHLLEDKKFYQRVVISIKYRHQLYGYLWIYEANEQFADKELTLITEIAARLGKILYNNQQTVKNDTQTLLWKLVNGEYENETDMLRAVNKTQFEIPATFAIMILSIKDPNQLFLLDKIKAFFIEKGIAFYLGKGTEIIGLVDSEVVLPSKNPPEMLLDELHKSLGEKVESLFIGIGNKYKNISFIRESYLEALEVIETMTFLNVREQSIYLYHDLGMFRHLKTMYKKNVSEQYRNAKIVTLMERDIKTNSELVNTVWSFLKNDSKVGKTAEDLFIHPNTLHYRLKQVEELVEIDFTDVAEKVELYMELFMLQHVADYEEFYRSICFT